MTDEIILKLIKSSDIGDITIGLNLLIKKPGYEIIELFKTHGVHDESDDSGGKDKYATPFYFIEVAGTLMQPVTVQNDDFILWRGHSRVYVLNNIEYWRDQKWEDVTI